MSKITYKCLDNPAHSFWGSNNMEGITCPVCQFQVIPTGYYDPEYNELPHYNDLKKRCMSKNIKDITITLDGKIKTDNINNYNECLNCGSHEHRRFYNDNSLVISVCEECGFRVEGYGTLPDVTMTDKQLDAIYSYIQQLELCLISTGNKLPSNGEDIDRLLFEKSRT